MTIAMFKKLFTPYFLALSLLLFAGAAFAEPPIYTSFFSNVAVSGYDPVAYFTQEKAVKGNAKHSFDYQGAQWHFSSKENLTAFQQSPESYAPQYGGYCAWAVGNNKTAKGDPKQWSIENDKLYLNYNAEIKGLWLADKDRLITLANAYWPQLIK